MVEEGEMQAILNDSQLENIDISQRIGENLQPGRKVRRREAKF